METLKTVHLTLELTPFSGTMPSIAVIQRGGEEENLGEFCEDYQYNCEAFWLFFLPIQLYSSFDFFSSAMKNLLPIYTTKKSGGRHGDFKNVLHILKNSQIPNLKVK